MRKLRKELAVPLILWLNNAKTNQNKKKFTIAGSVIFHFLLGDFNLKKKKKTPYIPCHFIQQTHKKLNWEWEGITQEHHET